MPDVKDVCYTLNYFSARCPPDTVLSADRMPRLGAGVCKTHSTACGAGRQLEGPGPTSQVADTLYFWILVNRCYFVPLTTEHQQQHAGMHTCNENSDDDNKNVDDVNDDDFDDTQSTKQLASPGLW